MVEIDTSKLSKEMQHKHSLQTLILSFNTQDDWVKKFALVDELYTILRKLNRASAFKQYKLLLITDGTDRHCLRLGRLLKNGKDVRLMTVIGDI